MIAFLGGSHVGVLGLLTAEATSTIIGCVAYSQDVADIAKLLDIPTFNNIKDKAFVESLSATNMILSVHGREILSPEILKIQPCINVHPCFERFKGADPIGRLLKSKDKWADVTAHYITDEIDNGEIVWQERIKVSSDSYIEVYTELYPLYIKAILKVMEQIGVS